MTHAIDCDLDDDCACVRSAEFTGGTDWRGRWRRTWWLDLKRERVRFRYHVQVGGVCVRMPWLAWAMFS